MGNKLNYLSINSYLEGGFCPAWWGLRLVGFLSAGILSGGGFVMDPRQTLACARRGRANALPKKVATILSSTKTLDTRTRAQQ